MVRVAVARRERDDVAEPLAVEPAERVVADEPDATAAGGHGPPGVRSTRMVRATERRVVRVRPRANVAGRRIEPGEQPLPVRPHDPGRIRNDAPDACGFRCEGLDPGRHEGRRVTPPRLDDLRADVQRAGQEGQRGARPRRRPGPAAPSAPAGGASRDGRRAAAAPGASARSRPRSRRGGRRPRHAGRGARARRRWWRRRAARSCSSKLGLQGPLEGLAGGEEARLRRPDGDAQPGRDVGQREVLEMVEDEDRALVDREPPEGVLDGVERGRRVRTADRRRRPARPAPAAG